MALNYTTTDLASKLNGVKVLVYGQAGVGKTVLASTAPNPFLVSAEGGELSLRNLKLPMVKISTIEDLVDVCSWIEHSNEARQFETICIDSLSEIAEVVLGNSKKLVKDPRLAYGDLIEKMEMTIRYFRGIPRNVYMSAKMEYMRDELTGIVKYGPSMPGKQLAMKLPYFFDEVFRMGVNKTPQGDAYRFLQTQPDTQYEAKDRSGALASVEPPDLTHIFNKILGV